MSLLHLFRSEPIIKSSNFLLSARLCFFSVAWMHLIIAAVLIIPIDMSGDPDPKIRAYQRLKWKFITTWFNLINLAYFPLCIYCDWKERKGEENQNIVPVLRHIRDVIFTSILFPTILFADTIFWRLYLKDMTLISPVRLFNYLPSWGQHSLHTVSMVVVILDLLLVPRRRPITLIPRLTAMTLFFLFYVLAVVYSYLQGEMVYQVFEVLTSTEVFLLTAMSYTENLIFFSLEWFIINYIWGNQVNKIRCI